MGTHAQLLYSFQFQFSLPCTGFERLIKIFVIQFPCANCPLLHSCVCLVPACLIPLTRPFSLPPAASSALPSFLWDNLWKRLQLWKRFAHMHVKYVHLQFKIWFYLTVIDHNLVNHSRNNIYEKTKIYFHFIQLWNSSQTYVVVSRNRKY